MRCPNCERSIPDESVFCLYCGKGIAKTKDTTDSLDNTITAFHLVPGAVISNRYQIQKIIGRGGMGIVYLALDKELDIEVALKVLPLELSMDERAIRSLKNEAKTAMKLSHPNIIRLYNFQSHEGLNFIVMEYVKGKNLNQILSKREKFAIKETIAIAEDVCSGLAYAHMRGVVHRDIKPQNFMQDEDGTIKIADFGIARIVTDTMQRVTQTATTGTLVYMSPEQLQGMKVDRRSDIYSLGCCLYEFLSGRPPFWTGDIYHQHLERKPQRLRDMPDGINTMLLTCLAKAPGHRYQTVEDLHKAIHAIEEAGKRPALSGVLHKRKRPKKERKSPGAGLIGKLTNRPWRVLFALAGIMILLGFTLALIFRVRHKEGLTDPIKAEDPIQEIKPVMGHLFIETEPDGAMIRFLNIKAAFENGMALNKGDYHVEVTHEGWAAKRRWVSVNSGEDQHVTINLTPLTGRLFVETEPGDATIELLDSDSKYAQGMALDQGRYQLAVSREGFGTENRWITLEPGEDTRILISLVRLKGRLYVQPEPENAAVRVLNINPKYSPGIELEPGRYHIEVSSPGYETKREWVSLNGGEDKYLDIDLELAKEFIVPSINYTMVYIPQGTFLMGSPLSEEERNDDEPQHEVTISEGFYMGVTEVTQDQWRAIMGTSPSHFDSCGGDCPVESVSWEDCQGFIRTLNQKEGTSKYRLPTEAEWEYACRAGTQTPFSYGTCLSVSHANYNGDYPYMECSNERNRRLPISVGSLAPNAWGLYDMHGNVWEWCKELYGKYPASQNADSEGPLSEPQRVVRGGSWHDPAGYCRSAFRRSYAPNVRYLNVGLRLARSP